MSKRVLVVEDNLINQKLMTSYLSSDAVSCDLAENGQEALDMVNFVQYDLIFMDISMPVMDGIECTQKIRSNSDSIISELPVVAVTAKTEINDRTLFNDIIHKPFDLERLQEVMNVYISSE